jgi:preprotein translocase subunit SecA
MEMGFWTWLTGKKSYVTTTDRIWLTKAAKWRGLCGELFEHLSIAQPSVLLAHFPATLAEVQQELSRQGVSYRSFDHSISAKEVNRLAHPGGLIRLGLVKQLEPDPFPDQHAERVGLIQILVAERHFLRECDDVVITFAGGLGKRCHVTYHCSLEDPLMKVFAGEWVKEVLARLGMDESAPVESGMVAQRVRGAQRKFAARAERECDADSAEEWLQSNGFGDPPS